MQASGQLLAVSNNRADQDYLFSGTGVISAHIPSLCLYTDAVYAPSKSEFVCFGDRGFFPPSPLLVEKPTHGYTWKDLYSYKGIVHIPYEMSTMSLFEQYSAGVPLWLPTKQYYKECILRRNMPFGSIYASVCPAQLQNRLQSLDFWLDRADYYDAENFRGIHFYDSPEDCIRQLTAFHESPMERAERQAWIAARRNTVFLMWADLLGAPGTDFLHPK
jgi:hypothetical protein